MHAIHPTLGADTSVDTSSSTSQTTFLDLGGMVDGLDQYHKLHDFKACHAVLHLPELCAAILEHMDIWELRECMEIGGPIAEVIKTTPKLAREIFLEFGSEGLGFHNPAIFWDTTRCAHWPVCNKDDRWEGFFTSDKMGHLKVEMDHHSEDLGGVVELFVEGYDNIVAALQSGDSQLQEYLGNRCIGIKLVVQNDSYLEFEDGDWQGPPSAISWKAAEITIRLPRLGVMLSVAKKLYDCAEDMAEKLVSGELDRWDEESDIVEGLAWQSLFSGTELDIVLCDQPKFRWFNGGGPQSYLCGGTSFAEHRRQHASYWGIAWTV